MKRHSNGNLIKEFNEADYLIDLSDRLKSLISAISDDNYYNTILYIKLYSILVWKEFIESLNKDFYVYHMDSDLLKNVRY